MASWLGGIHTERSEMMEKEDIVMFSCMEFVEDARDSGSFVVRMGVTCSTVEDASLRAKPIVPAMQRLY